MTEQIIAEVLELGGKFEDDVAGVIAYAKKNVVIIDYNDMEAVMARPPVGDKEQHRMTAGNIRVVYSIERHTNVPTAGRGQVCWPDKLFHHLSVSIPGTTIKPSTKVMNLIMQAFGMGSLINGDVFRVWFEGPKDQCVNILVPMEGYGDFYA